MTYFKNFINNEEGQDLVEYALIMGFVALAAVVILTALGTDVTSFYSTVDSHVKAATK
jgi:pilus assembly protein Flp/PilA